MKVTTGGEPAESICIPRSSSQSASSRGMPRWTFPIPTWGTISIQSTLRGRTTASALLPVATNGVIAEAKASQRLRVVEVATIEDDRLAQQATHHLEVGVAELLPLGDDCQSVGPLQRSVGPITVDEAVAVDRADVGQRLGIVDAHLDAVGKQGVDEHQRRGLADVIGTGLERQAPDRQGLLLQRLAVVLLDFLIQNAFLRLVDAVNRLHDPHRRAQLARHRNQSPHVLGKAASPISRSGM